MQSYNYFSTLPNVFCQINLNVKNKQKSRFIWLFRKIAVSLHTRLMATSQVVAFTKMKGTIYLLIPLLENIKNKINCLLL